MSIALTQKVVKLEQTILDLIARVEALESSYNPQHTPVDPPKRRGRPPKNEND
jgi:hypothetical protein